MNTETVDQMIENEVQRRIAERGVLATVKPGGRVLQVGQCVFIRTVTHHYTGRITLIEPDALVLEMAAWIPEDGRFSVAMESGELEEVEPYPDNMPVEISRGALLDVSPWPHPLPRARK